MSASLADVMRGHFRWRYWEELIALNGVTIERPFRSLHPVYPEIVYPIDYGYVNGTTSSDGSEVDVFVGGAELGLVGLIMTQDFRRNDREVKLLYNCGPREVYLAHGFINFDQRRMEGTLVLRYAMSTLWNKA